MNSRIKLPICAITALKTCNDAGEKWKQGYSKRVDFIMIAVGTENHECKNVWASRKAADKINTLSEYSLWVKLVSAVR